MRDRIPIFFSSCGKENGHSWSKEKTLKDELTGKRSTHPKRRPAVTHCQPNPEVAYRLRYTRISNRHIPAFESAEHNGAENRIGVFLLPCVPLRYALLVRFLFYPRLSSFVPLGAGFSCPVPRLREGFPKGRDRSPAPLCHEGVWGTGGVPHVSGGGLRGRGLYAKGPFPLPYHGNVPLREQRTM